MQAIMQVPNKELSPMELYKLTQAEGAQKMVDIQGVRKAIFALIYEGINKSTGEMTQKMSIMFDDGSVAVTISPSFIEGAREFFEMVQPARNFLFSVKTVTTQKGRQAILFVGEGVDVD